MESNGSPKNSQDVIRAIEDGLASPTIPFAIEKRGQVIRALEAQVVNMNERERKAFAIVVNFLRSAIANKLQNSSSFSNEWATIAAPLNGFSIGAVVEFVFGVPYASVSGTAAGFALQTLVGRGAERHKKELLRKLQVCEDLLGKLDTSADRRPEISGAQ